MEEGEAKGEGETGGLGGTSAPSTPDDGPSVRTLQENLANLLELKTVHSERLHRIDQELAQLHKFKKDYEHLHKRLKSLPDKITHEVMVPLGPLALMPGQLVHTNEVLVLLGDNWFAQRSAKQACEIVRRRIKDCEEKIRSAENSRSIHEGWLGEAEELLMGEEGQQVEIIEEMTEEEYQRSQEEHRRRVSAEYTRLREEAPHHPPSPTPSPQQEPLEDTLVETINDGDRRSYEALMRRLDQLEMEEMGEVMEPLEEEDEEEEEEEEDDAGVFNEVEEEEDNNKMENSAKEEDEGGEEEAETKTASTRPRMRGRLHSAEAGGCVGEGANDTDGAESDRSDHSDRAEKTMGGLPRKYRLRRRVSWADDVRPLYTIIPDDGSEEVHRIPYTSTPTPPQPLSLSLGALEGDAVGEEVQSPSDLYRVFGQPPAQPSSAPPDGKDLGKESLTPRSILKKSKSLPSDDSGGGDGGEDGGEGGVAGWCCPPKPLDLEGDEEIPPPPPSPPPRRALSLKPRACLSLASLLKGKLLASRKKLIAAVNAAKARTRELAGKKRREGDREDENRDERDANKRCRMEATVEQHHCPQGRGAPKPRPLGLFVPYSGTQGGLSRGGRG